MKFLMVVLIASLAVGWDEAGKVKTDIDTLGKKADTFLKRIENSELVDSIQSKGGKILDSVRSKGGKLIDKAEEKFNDLKKKDSTK